MNTNRRINIGLSALAVMALSTALPLAAAEIYRWVDKNGVTQYSDTKPPTQQKSETINIQQSQQKQQPDTVAPRSGTGTLEQKEAEYRQRQFQRQQQEQREQQAQREREQAALRCGNARGNLADLEKPGRIYTYDGTGKRVYSDNSERAAILERARARVAALCR